MICIYSRMSVLKVETDIITIASITVSPIGTAMIMYVKTFKTDVIVFICIKHDNVMH